MYGSIAASECLDLLVREAAYPMLSPKGKVYFRAGRRGFPSQEDALRIIDLLEIRTADDCRRIRREVSRMRSELRDSKPIKRWIREERPREMLLGSGPAGMPPAKLLSIILRTGREGASAEDLSIKLLNRFEGLRGIDNASIEELCSIRGIGPAKAAQIKAAIEIGKRLSQETARKRSRIKRAEDAIAYVSEFYGPYLRDARKEFFHVILLDIKNKPVKNIEISKGSVNASLVDPREIVREAALNSASAVILVHNHPSGETEPSPEDLRITKSVTEACSLMGIKVLDHIIIGKNPEDYYSFAKWGLITAQAGS